MEEIPSPKDMRGAAGVAVTLAYATGLAGVVAGALLFQRGETTIGVVVIVITFAIGAALMIASYLVRGLAAVLAHITALESDVRVLLADRSARDPRRRDRGDAGDRSPWP
ncbi:MAG: hypothetical protein KY457_02515 [Actinobacteria bacterium]|nr:hypothetical protein [Actinomycetota bacterium]